MTAVAATRRAAAGPHSPAAMLPMQQADWLTAAQRCLQAPGTGAELAPWSTTLGLVATGWPPRLLPAGAQETGEPCDLPVCGAAELDAAVARLARQPRPLRLPRMPAQSPTLAALRAAFRGRGLVWARPAAGTPFVTLGPQWHDPLAPFNAGRRSDFRRAQRQAEKLGRVTCEVHTAVDPATLDRLLDEAYAVEARSWKGEQGSALALDARLGPFFRQYAHAAMPAGHLQLAFLRVDEQAVAMQIALRWAERLWLLKIGYDPAYARCSPGSLLMLHVLGDAARQGLRSCELLGRTEPWTALWASEQREHLHVDAYPLSLAGLVALLLDASRRAAVGTLRAWRRLRQPAQPAAAGEESA